MDGLFICASAFNGDISSWNVAKVTNMMNLFYGATAFNADLSAWSVGSVTVCPDFCGGGSNSICGVPTFTACTPSCTGGRTIQTSGGSSACSCPAGQTGTPGTNAVCGTCSLELTQKGRFRRVKQNAHAHTHTCARTHLCIQTHAHTHMCADKHMHTHIHRHKHTHTHTHSHTHTRTHTHTHTPTQSKTQHTHTNECNKPQR
jgi:surface protein